MRAIRRDRGQALLVVLLFLAVFLLVIWASLTLAGGALLGTTAIKNDTRGTYALDAGVAYAIGSLQLRSGGGCSNLTVNPLSLPYPDGTVTVSLTIIKAPNCGVNARSFNITVSSTNTSRTLLANVSEPTPGTWAVNWEAFQ